MSEESIGSLRENGAVTLTPRQFVEIGRGYMKVRDALKRGEVVSPQQYEVYARDFELCTSFIGENVVVFMPIGGGGSRLSPLTQPKSKANIHTGNIPIVRINKEKLKNVGIRYAFIAYVGQRNYEIVDEFRNDPQFTVYLPPQDYIHEDIGSADALKRNMENPPRDAPDLFRGKTILVIQSDTLIDIDIIDLLVFHYEKLLLKEEQTQPVEERKQGEQKKGMCTIVTKPVEEKLRGQYGLVEVDAEGRVIRFVEKNPTATRSNLANTGLYVFDADTLMQVFSEKEIRDAMEGWQRSDLPREDALAKARESKVGDIGYFLLPALAQRGILSTYILPSDALWYDIGTPQTLLEANRGVMDGQIKIEMLNKYRVTIEEVKDILNNLSKEEQNRVERAISTIREGKLYIQDESQKRRRDILERILTDKVLLEGPAIIGQNVEIENGVTLSHAVIGDDTKIEQNARIRNSVVRRNVVVGQHSTVENSIIASSAVVEENCQIQNSVIGRAARVKCSLKNANVSPEGGIVYPLENVRQEVTSFYYLRSDDQRVQKITELVVQKLAEVIGDGYGMLQEAVNEDPKSAHRVAQYLDDIAGVVGALGGDRELANTLKCTISDLRSQGKENQEMRAKAREIRANGTPGKSGRGEYRRERQ